MGTIIQCSAVHAELNEDRDEKQNNVFYMGNQLLSVNNERAIMANVRRFTPKADFESIAPPFCGSMGNLVWNGILTPKFPIKFYISAFSFYEMNSVKQLYTLLSQRNVIVLLSRLPSTKEVVLRW